MVVVAAMVAMSVICDIFFSNNFSNGWRISRDGDRLTMRMVNIIMVVVVVKRSKCGDVVVVTHVAAHCPWSLCREISHSGREPWEGQQWRGHCPQALSWAVQYSPRVCSLFFFGGGLGRDVSFYYFFLSLLESEKKKKEQNKQQR